MTREIAGVTGMRSGNGALFASPEVHYGGLERAHPRETLEWAASTIERLAVATSFQSSGLVILHIMREIRPDVPVLFLDTGFHFDETLDFRRRIEKLWRLCVVDLRGEHDSVQGQVERHGSELYRTDPSKCCLINKVQPLQKALEGFDGWISGIRRDQSPLRSKTPIIEAQMLPSGNETIKIHPLATWVKSDVDAYVEEHDIPIHPLLEDGYRSIGCRPCTRPVGADEDDRAGRWDGFAQTECGIHTFGRGCGAHATEAEQ